MYAEVIPNLPVEGTFHYHIPAKLAPILAPGHLVEVDFGRQRAQGVVVEITPDSPFDDTKPVHSLIDTKPVITEAQLATARWMSEEYLTPLAQCVQVFIPPGLSKRGDVLITPAVEDLDSVETHSDTQKRLINLIRKRGPVRGRQIAKALPRRNWRQAVTTLEERGILIREPVLAPPSVRAKTVRMVDLAMPPDEVEAFIGENFNPEDVAANRQAAATRRGDILRALAQRSGPQDVGTLYAAVPGAGIADLRTLADADAIRLYEAESLRDPIGDITFVPDEPPNLTADQARAWDYVCNALDENAPHPILLHGVTGSGKTEIYLRAVEKVIEQGKRAIALVPEIALTPQTVRRFGARFPGRLGLIHSGLSQGERYDTWRRARNGDLDVVVGPRSALFTPLEDLALIVIDECHDDSYKHTPPLAPPYFHSTPVALELARQTGALVIMGSATPNISDYAQSAPPDAKEKGRYVLIDLPGRIMGHRRAIEQQATRHKIDETRYVHRDDDPDEAVMIDLPPVQVVDMRQELRAGNKSIFSRALKAALEETLAREEQAILFLNRRGTATYVFCRSCGHVMACPNCDNNLAWHAYREGARAGEGVLVCHHCGHREGHPTDCPECGSAAIKYFGGGTEQVAHEVETTFPEAWALRWDSDTAAGKFGHEHLLQRFVEGQANVLIGTQMVAKGLDLPMVTLVGVISADTALYLPDYRSGERTFQLLTQVAGRAGRGLLGGQVVLQTYAPEHYAIRAAAGHDFAQFYERELAYRAEIGYPPYNRLARVLIREETSAEAQAEAEAVHGHLRARIAEEGLRGTALIGPAPCFYHRRDNVHRWHVIVRGPEPSAILGGLKASPRLHIDVDPVSLL